jgi:hypothetical protein
MKSLSVCIATVFSFAVCVTHASDITLERKQLIECARTLKVHEQQTKHLVLLEEVTEKSSRAELGNQRFALLLKGFIAADKGDFLCAERAIGEIIGGDTVEDWKQYCVRILQATLARQRGERVDLMKSVDWLIDNQAAIQRERLTNEFCAALMDGLEKGKGPYEAGLLVTKAGLLAEEGRTEDAKSLYGEIIQRFPGTEWSVSARNRLHHLGRDEESKNLAGEK